METLKTLTSEMHTNENAPEREDKGRLVLSENFGLNASLHGQNVLVVGNENDYSAVVVPNILQRNASYVVDDPSGIYFEKTHEALEEGGYKTVRLMAGASSYNIFRNMDTFGIRNLCAAISPHNKANRIIMGVMLRFCFYKIPPEERSLASIERLLLRYKGRCLEAAGELKEASDDEEAFGFVLMLNENAIWAGLKPLFDIDPGMEAAFMAEDADFSIEELCSGRCAAYVSSSCPGIVFSALLRDYAVCIGDRGSRTVFFPGYLPECRIRSADAVFATSGKCGASLVYYAGGLSDIEMAYGRDKESVIGNTNAVVYAKTKDSVTAERLSSRVGSILTRNEIMSRPEGSCIVFLRGNDTVFDSLPASGALQHLLQ